MNPKINELAVELGHLNPLALKALIEFTRSGEVTDDVSAEAPAPAPAEDSTPASDEASADETPETVGAEDASNPAPAPEQA